VEAHEAIRPTVHTLAQLNADSKDKEAQLYALIYKHTMQSCMADAVYDVVLVSLTNSFSREWSLCRFDGWTRSNERSNERSNNETEFQWARHLTPNSVLTCRQIVQCSSNKVPNLFTESSLIQKMREKQFGRPSTYAHIVQHIQDRGYIKKTHKTTNSRIVNTITWDSLGKHESKTKESVLQINRLHITPTGLRVMQFLIDHFEPLFAYSFTQTLESQLDQIEQSPSSSSSSSSSSLRTQVVQQCDAQIMALIHKVNAVRSNAVSDTVTVHCGKYGMYAENNETGEKKAIVATSTKKQATILTVTANMATKALAKGDIVRTLSPDLTIRVGPRGHYLFYKTADMKKPIFKDVSKCPMDYSVCDLTELMHWIQQTHGITH
jgi:DNA topoisomerase-1